MTGGLFSRLFRKERPVEKRARKPRPTNDDRPEEQAILKELDNESLLLDHHFVFRPQGKVGKQISCMEYLIAIENTTDYPMGKIKIDFKGSSPLGKFGEPVSEKKLLDPSDKLQVSVPFFPSYNLGKDKFAFELSFFDFKYKVDEKLRIETEPLKVATPKFTGMEVDETTYQFLTADLYRWPMETLEVDIPPMALYGELKQRFLDMGFKQTNELLSEKQFRGICQVVAKDTKGRKWAAQVQVIGTPKASKLLLYTYAEKPQSAYNLAARAVSKTAFRDKLVRSSVIKKD
ncbi:MAG: hypothetical protein MUC62_09170 [Candidatus Thermoplasmatota archaeon]|jgi:hypothetical protein|nr:hypothetical protein [Candidatus Thermoplasmatota archaeon]